MTIFNTIQKYDPHFLGFKPLLKRLAEFDAEMPNTGYPPYNIIQDGEKYFVELAVAGFSESDISITHEPNEKQLIIEGSTDKSDVRYLHKGIGGRRFKRVLTVIETMVVNSANLVDGILTIELENIIPEERKPKQIAIGKKQIRK
tara:strand:- start:168 stop:602 length:435 start_codon:yes stop_codon:yes gene_type:complete